MATATKNGTDLSEYQDRVLADDDKPLFDEAVKSAGVGALRGAYILLWLSCLESGLDPFWWIIV